MRIAYFFSSVSLVSIFNSYEVKISLQNVDNPCLHLLNPCHKDLISDSGKL